MRGYETVWRQESTGEMAIKGSEGFLATPAILRSADHLLHRPRRETVTCGPAGPKSRSASATAAAPRGVKGREGRNPQEALEHPQRFMPQSQKGSWGSWSGPMGGKEETQLVMKRAAGRRNHRSRKHSRLGPTPFRCIRRATRWEDGAMLEMGSLGKSENFSGSPK